MPIAVDSQTEPLRVIELLTKVAAGHSLVSKDPPAQALLTNLANGTASFELRAWTDQAEDWQRVRSNLFMAIKSSLAADGVKMH
jgi:small-conductance mechanosensitive channel